MRFIASGLNHARPLGQKNGQCHMPCMSQPVPHLSDRRVITVRGPESRDFLQRVITTDMKRCSPGTIQAGALLTPQGKIICDFLIHGEDEGVVLDVPADAAESLAKRLSLYRLRAKADILLDAEAFVVSGTGAPDPRSATLPLRAIVSEKPGLDGVQDQTDLEITHGVPAFGRDYGEAAVFPTDVNLDLYGGIGWKKGCFIGQEVLSRMKRRGTIRKRTVSIASADRDLAINGAIKAGSTPLGTLTSTAGKTALALIRLDRLDAAQEPPMIDGHPVIITLPPGLAD